MSPPLIGITTYGQDEESKFGLPRQYVDAVRRAGGMAFLIAPGTLFIPELLAAIDGLMLTGGGDLDPRLYGGRPHESIYMLDSERDATELELATAAIQAELPMLGICRGAQVINVALGGTLHEHLPDVVGDDVDHRLPPREPTEHVVHVQAESLLASIMGEPSFSAASWHHQAIRDVAPGLDVVAHAPDKTVEAVEMKEHPWLIGVQWHPELTAQTDDLQQRLFEAFVTAAASLRRENGG